MGWQVLRFFGCCVVTFITARLVSEAFHHPTTQNVFDVVVLSGMLCWMWYRVGKGDW